MADPWASIACPSDPRNLSLRRADARHPLEFFRGRDAHGSYVFCFQGVLPGSPSLALPRLTGIDVSLRQIEGGDEGAWQLTLTLLDGANTDIFRALCADLMSATENVSRGDDAVGIDLIVSRLNRWQRLLRTRRDHTLSVEQRIGLFGELLVLRDVFMRELAGYTAIQAWRGPSRDEQDFVYGEWTLEVKTQLASADRAVQVSSEDQLDTRTGRLLLCHQTLGTAREGEVDARTLDSLVREIEAEIEKGQSVAGDLFRAILLDHGYEQDELYERDFWVLSERTFYEIGTGFPRIVPSVLPSGIEGVTYRIRLASCSDYRVSERDARQWVFGRDEN